ncbi:MAG: glycine zipper family protein [Nitrosomonas sp.]|nr:glycine zipper family protein [Nitrosomonas sp.]
MNKEYLPTHHYRYILIGFCLLIVGCASPRPILYPNAHLNSVGQQQAEQDIAECKQIAEQYASSSNAGEQIVTSTAMGAGVGAASGAVAGAMRGSASSSSLIGAAAGATVGLIRGLMRGNPPNHAYQNFVNQCLRERGYQSVGWD